MSIVNEVIVTGRKKRRLIDKQAKLWQLISYWTKASDVEFDDGRTAEEKLGGCTFSVREDGVYVTYAIGGADTVTKKLGSVVKILALLEELESPSKSDSEEDICEAIRNLLTIWYQKGLSHSIGNGNVKIKYTYHKHTGNENVKGGCYQEGYHVHTAACPTHIEKKYIGQKSCTWRSSTRPGDDSVPVCPNHGMAYHWGNDAGGGYRKYGCNYTWEEYIDTPVYDCGYPANKWKVNCGRQVGDVDKVEIIYYEPKD